jgi:hypothetical protein
VYYYRNILNARNVKAEVKNSYRAYKMLYRTLFDGMCCVLFLKEFGLSDISDPIPVPDEWNTWEPQDKVDWLDGISSKLVRRWFLEDTDLLKDVREVLSDPDSEENYWILNTENGRFKCHFCQKTFAFIASVKTHECKIHGYSGKSKEPSPPASKASTSGEDELYNYIILLFRLAALHRNLDSAVDMADGPRSVRSAKFETPIYNKTNKTKYFIGSVHLTGLVSGTLSHEQTERLIANRCVNLIGGKNHNCALDEYVELLNRDTKNTCTGFQTKESIIAHSKEFPHLIDAVKHFDIMCQVRKRKGFHKLPSYKLDVKKVAADLLDIDAFTEHPGRSLRCRSMAQARNPYTDSEKNLTTMIHRHKPVMAFRRLRNRRT